MKRTQLEIENRIALLQGRLKDNGRIVQKLQRQLRNMKKTEA